MLSRETLLEIHKTVDQIETQMDSFNQVGLKIARRTQIIIRSVIFILRGSFKLSYVIWIHGRNAQSGF